MTDKPFKLVKRTLAKQLDYWADKLEHEEAIDRAVVAASLRMTSVQVGMIEKGIEALSKIAVPQTTSIAVICETCKGLGRCPTCNGAGGR